MSTDITQTRVSPEPKVVRGGGCCGPSTSTQDTRMTNSSTSPGISLEQDRMGLLRYWLRDRRVLIGLVVAAVVAGAAFNWSWLVAAGLAPIVLMMAPCGGMCAIGMCKKGKGTSTGGTNAAGEADGSPPPPVRELTNRQ